MWVRDVLGRHQEVRYELALGHMGLILNHADPSAAGCVLRFAHPEAGLASHALLEELSVLLDVGQQVGLRHEVVFRGEPGPKTGEIEQ